MNLFAPQSVIIAIACAATTACAVHAETGLPIYIYEIRQTYPHDPQAFTQGLLYRDGFLFESTGRYGASTIRKVDLQTGAIVQSVALPDTLFGEGLTDWNDTLISVTWHSGTGFVLSMEDLQPVAIFEYPGEGWGLARSDQHIFLSDGTAELRVLDPETMAETRRIRVTAEGSPVTRLNELEWVNGEIFANIWQTERIARIDPDTGEVTGWIDLSGLLDTPPIAGGDPDVLNGIAYDAAADRLFVTGKLWPRLFEIEVRPAQP